MPGARGAPSSAPLGTQGPSSVADAIAPMPGGLLLLIQVLPLVVWRCLVPHCLSWSLIFLICKTGRVIATPRVAVRSK